MITHDPKVLDKIREPNTPVKVDDRALKEEDNFARGEKRALHIAFKWFIGIAAITFFIIFLARASHLILPASMQWLTPEQVQGIDKLLYSGAIGGFIGRYFSRLEK